MNCWVMRMSRDNDESAQALLRELRAGRIRQGWGWHKDQDLGHLQSMWEAGQQLSAEQQATGRHWRMGNGAGGDYMQVGDLVVVPNIPQDGLFTICRITGDYYFEILDPLSNALNDFGHVRPVEVLTPLGVANDHELVHADLRRSFRCRSRLWNVRAHRATLNEILERLEGGLPPQSLTSGSTPMARVESIVPDVISRQMDSTKKRLAEALGGSVRAEEWEPVLQAALEHLFPVSVYHCGGRGEQGADLEIVIPNPFGADANRDWIVPVQVKDYEGEVGAEVAEQLEHAFISRSETGQVIAVVLLVSNAEASKTLIDRMSELEKQHKIPFFYCGREEFLNILGRGFLRRF